MNKFSSKISKNENSSDISLYLIYLTTLHETPEIKFIQRNSHWLQPRFPNDLGISFRPF